MNDAFSKYSIPAIENLRKYVDHSLIDMAKLTDVSYATHNSLIPLSGLHIRLGNLDEGLISLIECIKLAQNKKDNQGIIKCLIWLQQIVKAFGNVEQAEMLILEQILIQCCIHNLPQLFNSMALEYSQLCTVYKRHDASQKLHRIKRVKTEEKPQNNKDDPEDLISVLMAATQNNLIKIHQGVPHKESHAEIRNYHVETKPMYRMVRTFQWGNEGEKSLMLANYNSLVTNYPEALKHIDITNSTYQVIAKLAKEDLAASKYLDMVASEPTKNDFYFVKLVNQHCEALNKYEMDYCRTLEDMMLLYNEKTNNQLEYSTIWERRLQRLYKEELFDNALTSAKEFLKFCDKQGFMLKRVEYELFIAKVHMKCDAYHEALFQALKIIDKTEEWQMTILNLESKIVLSEIHFEMGAYYEALTLLNEIEATVLSKMEPEMKAIFHNLKAKVTFFLSNEVVYNERGGVIMKKAAIKGLETSVNLCSQMSLYQQLREALFLKSVIADLLADLYYRRQKVEQYEEFRQTSDASAKEFNNIDAFIEETIQSVCLREVTV
jgi:hypothetical protein